MKVGGPPEDDARRIRLVREEIGPDSRLMIDANQRWEVKEAIERVRALARYDIWWMEEPTFPDDVLGHATIARGIAPIRVATGEHCANRVLFKQLLQAEAIGVCQIDSCRLGGVNENLAVMLMAAKFGVPVCPHAGGVGLCEHVQHLSMFDFIGITGTMENRVIEFVDHLHEHFVDPVVIRRGHYMPPTRPGLQHGDSFAEGRAGRHGQSSPNDVHPTKANAEIARIAGHLDGCCDGCRAVLRGEGSRIGARQPASELPRTFCRRS